MRLRYTMLAFAIGAAVAAGPAAAGGVATQLSQAGTHSVQAVAESGQAVGHSVVGAGKVASAAVAVPLLAVEQVGAASGAVGDVLWDAASDEPAALPVSPDTVTAGPLPNEALTERL